MAFIEMAETPIKEKPRCSLAASHQGLSKSSYPLCTPYHRRAQELLARRYRLNRASAVFVADILCAGER